MQPWQEVLQAAGFPTTAIVLDFETYYDADYSLKKMSTVECVMDKRFEITGLGMQLLPNGDISFSAPNEIISSKGLLTTPAKQVWDGLTVVGQNLKFDALILREKFGITPKYTVDLIDLDRQWDAQAKHSLEAMAKRWGAPKSKGDTNQFKGFHWKEMGLVLTHQLKEYCKNDIEIESFLFQKLLPLVTCRPEIELPLMNQTLQLFLNPQIEIDFERGEELKKKMRLEALKPRLELRKHGIKSSRKWISGNKKFTALLQDVLPENETIPMKQGKNKPILAFAKDDEGLKQLLVHPKEEVRLLTEARIAIKSWPLHISRVDKLMNQAKARGGKIGAPLKYCSAHTWRWGGTESINLQNLGGRGRTGAGTHPLIQAMRGMLIASDDYIFGINDLKQIQARILPWLAGQNNLIQGFANGDDIYSEFATELFQFPVREAKKTDPGPVAKLLTIRRGFGKDAILGCGFGMGANKFYERCMANNDLRPMFDSGEYDWNFIKRLINTYRSRYAKIPAFWKKVEKAWRFVTKYPGQKSEYFIEKEDLSYMGFPLFYKTTLEPYLKFNHQDEATYIQLPSGRYLRYPGAKVKRGGGYDDGDLSYQYSKYLWGGFLTENIVQAVEVDIFGEALLRLEAAGFNIVLHGHDEIICLFKESEAEEKLKEMAEIMVIVPEWAQGLPIAVEGELTKRYKK